MNNRFATQAFKGLATAAATAIVTFAAGGAWGQGTVYRCGDSYSQQPCPGGVAVPAEDARSAQQKAQADAATRRDTKAADAMQKERLRQEARPAAVSVLPVPAASAPAPPEPARQLVKKKKHKKEPDYFTAVAPRKPGDKPAGKKKEKKAAKDKVAP